MLSTNSFRNQTKRKHFPHLFVLIKRNLELQEVCNWHMKCMKGIYQHKTIGINCSKCTVIWVTIFLEEYDHWNCSPGQQSGNIGDNKLVEKAPGFLFSLTLIKFLS